MKVRKEWPLHTHLTKFHLSLIACAFTSCSAKVLQTIFHYQDSNLDSSPTATIGIGFGLDSLRSIGFVLIRESSEVRFGLGV